jgi:hypothetical protein
MKTALLGLVLALTLPPFAGAAPGPIQGRWLLDFTREEGRAELTMRRTDTLGHWSSSHTVSLSDLQGLSRPPQSSAEVPARFSIVRDAGTIAFEGRLDAAGGSGRFEFTAAAGFAAAMARAGAGNLSEEEIFAAAVHDVSRQLVSELASLGYAGLSFDSLVSMRIHGASPEFVRELKGLGYEHLPADDLVAMRIHGASPEFVRALKDLGYEHLPADDLVAMRIHGASPEFVRELKGLGYDRLSTDDLVSMRIHGVSPDYVRGLQELGYRHLSVDQLVSMRIHGVTLEFVKRMLGADPAISADGLVDARIHARRGD